LILRDLMFRGAKHYADFLNAGEGISTNILANRLSRLENEDVIEKQPDPEHGKRFIYRLTEKGIGLLPVMVEIIDWAEIWDSNSEVSPEFAKEFRANRSAFVEKISNRLKFTRQME